MVIVALELTLHEPQNTLNSKMNSDPEKTLFPLEITSKKPLNTLIWIAPRVVAVTFLGIIFAWIYQAEGGIGLQQSSLFGLHAMLMTFFVVVFYQEALLSFKAPLLAPLTSNPKSLKLFHVVCHLLGISFAIGGLVAIAYYKQLAPQEPMYGNQYFPFYTLYSPHSWLGIAFLSLWVRSSLLIKKIIQAVLRMWKRSDINRIHTFLGSATYCIGLAVCALGLQDMQSSDLASSPPPMNMDMSGIATNMTMGGMGMNMTGYFPASNYAQYSSAGVLLLALCGLTSFAALAVAGQSNSD